MRKIYLRVLWLVIIVGLIVSIGSLNVSARAEEINCALCHKQTSPEGLVDLNSCTVCHGANHEETRRETTTTVYGQFLTEDSLNTSIEELGNLHDGQNSRGTRNDCYQCHGVVDSSSFTAPQENPTGVLAHDLNNIHSLNLVGSLGLNCTSCHSNRLDTEHLSRVQNDGSNYDCTVCHGPLGNKPAIVYIKAYKDQINQIGSVDNWVCEQCHTPHGPYYSLHQNGFEQSCTKCHSQNLVREHVPREVECNNCHNNPQPRIQQTIDNRQSNCSQCHDQPQLHEKIPNECSSCHGEKAGDMSIDAYTFVKRQDKCKVCHTDHPIKIKTTEVVVNGTVYGYFKSPDSLNYSSEEIHKNHYKSFGPPLSSGCKKCHGTGKEDSSSGFIACFACHEEVAHGTHYQPSNVIPKTGKAIEPVTTTVVDGQVHEGAPDNMVPATLTCLTAECHGSQKTNLRMDNNGKELCLNCHDSNATTAKTFDVHDMTVHKVADWPAIEGFSLSCEVCHSGMLDISKHKGKLNRQGQTMDCSTCHNPTYQPIIDQKENFCLACHPIDKTQGTIHSDWKTPHVTKELPTKPAVDCTRCHHKDLIGEHQDRGWDCATCHQSTKTNVVDAIKQGNSQCVACHETGFTKLHEDSNPECIKCHQEKTEAMTFRGYTPVSKEQRCQVCHSGELSGHETGYPLVTVSVYGKTYGMFKGFDSINFTSKELHQAHYGVNNSNLGESCTRCHGSGTAGAETKFIACYACHGTVNHGEHYLPSMVNPKTKDTIATPRVEVVDGLEHSEGVNNYVEINLTCLTSECHGTSTTSIALRTSTNDPLCWNCHNSSTAVARDKEGHGNTDSLHTTSWPQKDDQDCNSCHPGMNTVSTGHKEVDSSEGLVDCQVCHGSTKPLEGAKFPTVKEAIYAQQVACDSCHTLHGNVNDIHKTDLPSDCKQCHQDLLNTEHPLRTDSNNKAYDCNTCHKSTKPEVKKAISDKDTRCATCHTNAGGHSHPVAKTGFAGNPPVNCSKCHATSGDGTGELVKIHQEAADRGKIQNFGCTICHNQQFEGEDKVISKDGSIDMKIKGEDTIYCTDCHNGTLAHALSEKYPAHGGNHINATGYGEYEGSYNGVEFDDRGVDCSKCHDSLETKVVHDSTVHPNVTCNSCHESDIAEVKAVIEKAWSRATEKKAYTCANCHNSLPYLHEKDHQATGQEQVTCNVCHDGTTVKGSFNAPQGSGVNVADSKIHPSCNTCHGSSNTTVQKFIYDNKGATNTVYNCDDCHRSIEPKHNKLHEVNSYLPDSSTDCSECHDKDVTVTHAKAEAKCDLCHGTNPSLPNTKQTIFDNLSKFKDRKGYTCQSCHTNAENHDHEVAVDGYGAYKESYCNKCHATNDDGTAELVQVHQKAADAGKIQNFGCGICHNSTYEGSGKVIVKDGAIDMKKNGGTAISCKDCHERYHANLYPKHDSQMINTIDEDDNVCDTCHRTNLVSEHSLNGVSCEGCHFNTDSTVVNAIKGGSTLCWSCHSSHYPTDEEDPDRPKSVADAHKVKKFASKEKANCADCHDPVMTVEHVKHTGKDGSPISCGDCHKSDKDRIKRVIVNKGAQCDSCHDIHEDVDTVHKAEYGFKTELDCSSCHQNLLHKEHELHQDDQGKKFDCNVCHKSTKDEVKKAIKDQKTSCSECHTQPHTDIDKPHTTDYFKGKELDCSTCHSNLLHKEHEVREIDGKQGNCNTCHGSEEQKVIMAIAKNNEQCDACHEPPHSDLAALAEPHTVTFTKYAFACQGCHSNVLNVEHSSTRKSDDKKSCILCHDSKEEQVKQAIKKAEASCRSCHEIHTTPKDAHVLMFQDNKQTKCSSCHSIHKAPVWKSTQGRDD